MKTDNAFLADKIALRTQVIKAADLGDLRVLDTCAGRGIIWSEMKKRFKVASYTPCDKKPRMPGCIKMELDDRHLDVFNMAKFNVVDIDTYGDPFGAWLNLSKRLGHKTAFFLTHGFLRGYQGSPAGSSAISKSIRMMCAIPLDWNIAMPNTPELAFSFGLRALRRSTWVDIPLCLMATHENVRYYGLIVEPKKAKEHETVQQTKTLRTAQKAEVGTR